MKLEYGIPQDKGATHLQFGLQKGFFRDEGIDLSFRIVFGGPEIAACYDSGALKIGEMGTPPATTALAKGASFKIVASGVRRRALQYLVVRPDIAEWNDLRGGAVGVLSKGSCSYWFARLVLASHGLDPDADARIIGLGSRHPQVLDLLSSGELQAAVISEPSVAIGEYGGVLRLFKALNEPEYSPSMQWSVVIASADAIEKEPNMVAAVLRACRRSYHYAADNEDEFIDFGVRQYDVDRSTFARSISRERENLHYDCQIDETGLDIAIDLQRRLGAFEAPLSVREITDLRFVPG